MAIRTSARPIRMFERVMRQTRNTLLYGAFVCGATGCVGTRISPKNVFERPSGTSHSVPPVPAGKSIHLETKELPQRDPLGPIRYFPPFGIIFNFFSAVGNTDSLGDVVLMPFELGLQGVSLGFHKGPILPGYLGTRYVIEDPLPSAPAREPNPQPRAIRPAREATEALPATVEEPRRFHFKKPN